MNKTEEFLLKCDEKGRLQIIELNADPIETASLPKSFSTPNSDGQEFGKLFKDLKQGDELSITFLDVRICKYCGKQLKKETKK